MMHGVFLGMPFNLLLIMSKSGSGSSSKSAAVVEKKSVDFGDFFSMSNSWRGVQCYLNG